jgi:uncharacterized protein YbaP (TraB family)
MKKLSVIFSLLLWANLHAQYNSLFWKISGNDLKQPSYIFGTMHTSDARVFNFSKELMPAFEKSKAYAMELDPSKAFNLGIVSKLMMGKGYSLKKMIPETEYRFLDSVISKTYGFKLAMFDNVAPVFVMTLYESASMGLDESKDEKTEVLDLYFYKKAKKAKKKIIGIETVDEQLDALNALTYEEQVEMVVEEVRYGNEHSDAGNDLMRFYIEGQLDSLSQYDAQMQMPEKYYASLVTNRNKKMAERIGAFIKLQPVFIAVGALHLPGALGVIELLRQQGYKVEPIK